MGTDLSGSRKEAMNNPIEDINLQDLVEKTPNKRMHQESYATYKIRMREKAKSSKANAPNVLDFIGALLRTDLNRRLGTGGIVHHNLGRRHMKIKGWMRDPKTGKVRR
jgi:hypothetical protein